jgi:hypothetical protein
MSAVPSVPWARPASEDDETYEQFVARLAPLLSGQKVRLVVTRGGHRARGELPSFKADRARYESLLERSALSVAEVASDIWAYRTHPHVLALWLDGHVKRYTPDALVNYRGRGRLLEVKAGYFIRKASSRAHLLEVVKRLKLANIRLALLDDKDVAAPLQEELAYLLRHRPARGRYRPGFNASAFDPLGRSAPDAELERRWIAAQRECNELLARVMRRDPDEFIASLAE